MSENFLIEEKINSQDEIKNQIENISDNIIIDFPLYLDLMKIKQLNNKCSELILEEKAEDSLKILKKIELFLESNIMDKKLNFEKKLLIIILHNISCCHQKLKDIDNCISYLESVIYHFDFSLEKKHNIKINEDFFIQHIKENKDNYPSLGDLILELRYSAKFHLQMSAILSEGNRHIEALKHARLASVICEDNIVKTNYLYYQIRDKQIKNGFTKNSNNNSEEDNNSLNDKIKLNFKIINELYNLILNSRNYNNTKKIKNSFSNKLVIKTENNDNNNKSNNSFNSYLTYRESEIAKYNSKYSLLNKIRYIFGGTINQEDWIQLLNIENILFLSPLNCEDLDLDSDSRFELLKDTILEKVVMLTVSYFCISKEMKILSNEKNNKKINGEYYLNQAVEFASLFFPACCPIINYYISNYYKSYGQNMEIIPEGKIIDLKVNLIRSELEQKKETLSFIKINKINYLNKIPSNKNYLNNSNNNSVFKNINLNNILIPRLNINNNLNNNINAFNIKNINNNIINNENKVNNTNSNKIINFTDINNTSNINTNSNRNLNEKTNISKMDHKKKIYKSCEKSKKKSTTKKSKKNNKNKPSCNNDIKTNNSSNKSTKTLKFINSYNSNRSKGSRSKSNSKNKNNKTENKKNKFKNAAMKINLNLNIKHNNFDLLPNKNFLNFANKSKINEKLAPKFKLNFAKLNKSDNEENDTNDFIYSSNINSMNNLNPKTSRTSKKNTKMNIIREIKNKKSNIFNKKQFQINLDYNFLHSNEKDAKTERLNNKNIEIEKNLYNNMNKKNKNINLGRKNMNIYLSPKNNYSSLLMQKKEIRGNKTERVLNRNKIQTKNLKNKINEIRIKFNSPKLRSDISKTYRYLNSEINKIKKEQNKLGNFSFLNYKNKNNKNVNSLRYQYVNCSKKQNFSKSYYNSNNNSNSVNKESMIKSMDVINKYLLNKNQNNQNFSSENISFNKQQPIKNKINLNKHHLNNNLVSHFKNMKF